MIDQKEIEYKKVDLDKINSDQPLEYNKEQKRFSFKFLYNILDKTFNFKINWRI